MTVFGIWGEGTLDQDPIARRGYCWPHAPLTKMVLIRQALRVTVKCQPSPYPRTKDQTLNPEGFRVQGLNPNP